MYQKILSTLLLPLSLFSAPNAPTDLELEALSSSSVSITWKDNSPDERGFKIFRDDKLIMITDSNVTNYIDEGLSSATAYTYMVKATEDGLNKSLEDLTLGYDNFTLTATGAYESLSIQNNSLSYPYTQHATKTANKLTLYNIALLADHNELNVTVTYTDGHTQSTIYNIQNELNTETLGTLPLSLSVNKFSDVGELNATILIHTTLDVSEYIFDKEGDGVVDAISTDNNFTYNYTQEGRYRPKVTVKTTTGELYTTEYYALSLDVKADSSQKDPSGTSPLMIAKKFIQALLADDKETVIKLLGNNQKLIDFIYSDPKRLEAAKAHYRAIKPDSWVETYFSDKDAKVTMLMDIDAEEYKSGIELYVAAPQIYTGRYWVIKLFY